MAVMLRTLGVPARVAVGFTGGRDVAGARSVGTADAHAWVEAWFPGAGWTTFDPTPLTDGRAIVPPYVVQATGEADGPAGDQPAPEEAPPPAPVETATPQAGAPDTVAPESADAAPAPEAPAPAGSTAPVLLGLATALAAAVPVVAMVAGPIAWRARLRRRRLAAADAGGAGAAGAAWDELLAESADRSAPAVASDTVRMAADRMTRAHGFDAPARRALDTVVGTVEESWYGGIDPAPGALSRSLRTVSDALRAVPAPLHRRLFPASVIGGRRRRGEDQNTDDPAGNDRG
jgi:hypothetical protein